MNNVLSVALASLLAWKPALSEDFAQSCTAGLFEEKLLKAIEKPQARFCTRFKRRSRNNFLYLHKQLVWKGCPTNLAFNQLLDFLDKLDTSVYKHLVMLYEEPEYAKVVQMRFLNDGLKRGECCVYAARDDDDLRVTKADLIEYGIDVDHHMKKGLLQFYIRKPAIIDKESYKRARNTFQEEIEKTFASPQDDSTVIHPKIRGVGSISRDVFTRKENSTRATAIASQLLVERMFQYESTSSFDGVWMCRYQVENLVEDMDKEWMAQLLQNHDAVLFLPKLSNGIALNLRK